MASLPAKSNQPDPREAPIKLTPGAEGPTPVAAEVSNLTVRIKRLQTTDEGKLQVILESEVLDDPALAQVREMLTLQQTTLVRVTMQAIQQRLFDDA